MRDKTGLLALSVLLALVSAMLWSQSASLAPTMIWTLRFALPTVAIGLVVFTLLYSGRSDRAPDYLATMFRTRWECSGLCFATEQHERDGLAWIDVYYQNRYERRCFMVLKISIEATLRRPVLLQTRIDAAGGAFGVARIPIAVPRKFQGRKQRVLLDAQSTFPKKRGALLRMRGGKAIGSSDPGALIAVAAVLAGGLAGLMLAGQSRRSRIPLPDGVAEALPDDVGPENETLWLPGDDVIDLSRANDEETAINEVADADPSMLAA